MLACQAEVFSKMLFCVSPACAAFEIMLALRLTLWNEQMEEEKKTEKSNNKTHKKIEHGGENSYHALCCVFEVLENYRKGRG